MTAAEKVERTLRELSQPDDDAAGLELSLSTLAMAVESMPGLRDNLAENQEEGKVDEFILALTRWLATHRSDDARQLLVVELPKARHSHLTMPESPLLLNEIPAGTRLHMLDEAAKAAADAVSPL